MAKLLSDQLGEQVYYDVLSNGLTVYYVLKPDYHRTFAVLTTKFGAMHTRLEHVETRELRRLPAGVAHFLEHKMFEGQNGVDAFTLFMKQGAMANAYTNYSQTSYLFSSTYEIEQNIRTLLDFVQIPHFTPEGVEKEKGIIAQEWKMYHDDPRFIGYDTLQHSLYPNHSAGDNILGSLSSIEGMTYEDLRIAYDTFYHPSNLNLVIVGPINLENMEQLVQQHQSFLESRAPEYRLLDEPVSDETIPLTKISHDVTIPIVDYGVRLNAQLPKGEDVLIYRTKLEVLFELLFGPTSSVASQWYQEGLVDVSYDHGLVIDDPMQHLHLTSLTPEPMRLIEAWRHVLESWQTSSDLNEDHLQMIITGRIGDFLQGLNSLEHTASELVDAIMVGYDYFKTVEVLQSITLSELRDLGQQVLAEYQDAVVITEPFVSE